MTRDSRHVHHCPLCGRWFDDCASGCARRRFCVCWPCKTKSNIGPGGHVFDRGIALTLRRIARLGGDLESTLGEFCAAFTAAKAAHSKDAEGIVWSMILVSQRSKKDLLYGDGLHPASPAERAAGARLYLELLAEGKTRRAAFLQANKSFPKVSGKLFPSADALRKAAERTRRGKPPKRRTGARIGGKGTDLDSKPPKGASVPGISTRRGRNRP